MAKKKSDPHLQIVVHYPDKPDVQPLDTDRVQFHAPGGVPLFEVRAKADRIEVRGLGGMGECTLAIVPYVSNLIVVRIIED